MTAQQISAEDADKLVERRAILVDVGDTDEHARECISGAKYHALSHFR